MDINLILALVIPLSLAIMGFFNYKITLLFLEKKDKEVIKENIVPNEEISNEETSNNLNLNAILNEYLNGGE